jgi:UDP-N-acetyl-D-mannosaminuronic acid transferase (WecB/TagA/CpsF family)
LIDRFAGKEHRWPEWVRTCKCEWLYRAIRNPRKNGLKAFWSLSIFFILIFWSYFE